MTNVAAENITQGVGLPDSQEGGSFLVLPKDDSQRAVDLIFEAARELGLDVPDEPADD